MKCAAPGCTERVRYPYIRVAAGERGGTASYAEDYLCSWACAVIFVKTKTP
jgi:hypothetical protein